MSPRPTEGLIGQTFGSWLVLGYSHRRLWNVRCKCGAEKLMKLCDFKTGKSTQCRTCADSIDPVERFLDKVMPIPFAGCWLWMGAIAGAGYPYFHLDDKLVRAHRFAYRHFVGEIPDGLQIDHKCRIRLCVNPDHLQVVTAKENVRLSHLRRRLQ